MMTSSPLTATPEMPLKDAIQLLASHRISGLPVVDAAGEAIGEISETDLMWQVSGASLPAYVMLLDSVVYLTNPARYNQELHKALGQTVADVMSRKVTLIKSDDDLQLAAQLMHDKQIRRLLVVDDTQRVVGILTRGDIVRELAKQYS
ncbi:MAG: CBS domain-containing protein [Cyanobacteria bacterium P01_D01_bin.156]